MYSKINSAAVQGIDGTSITVEVDIAKGLPSLSIVGLPDTSVKEARDRVVAAIRNSGFDVPSKKITVNLAPAHIKKEGPSFDAPIALGILVADDKIKKDQLPELCLIGELALDGSLRSVKGALSIALHLAAKKYKYFMLPEANKNEAAVVKGINVIPVGTLRHIIDYLNGSLDIKPYVAAHRGARTREALHEFDFAEVKGQQFAKRALEIAAAGGHNVLLIGPPGSGKTMLAQRMPSILPGLTFEESLDTTRIYSVAGLLDESKNLLTQRPFRNPHHTISDIALIGGGQYPRPGEISLAHNGVLFLDEFPEFHRDVLEVLRQPMEEGVVRIARSRGSHAYPAQFMLIAAMNPCPCGYYGHPEKECLCTPYAVQKYQGKISGPLLDRIDMHIQVPALKTTELTSDTAAGEFSYVIQKRIARARAIQRQRFKKEYKRKTKHSALNAPMNHKLIKKYCVIDNEGKQLLEHAMQKLGLSGRAYDRILKVSRTIADLEGVESIKPSHIAETIQYRSLDKII